jgi:gas vesicle protein
MSRSSNGKGKSFLVGALLGTIAGGITALLLAPKSGKDMRKDLSKKAREAQDKSEELFNNVSDQALDLVDKAKSIAHDAKDAAETLVKELRRK